MLSSFQAKERGIGWVRMTYDRGIIRTIKVFDKKANSIIVISIEMQKVLALVKSADHSLP